MVFDSKLNINLYHEHFPDALEKYTRFSKFTLLFNISYVRVNGRLYAAKFAAAFFPSSLFAVLDTMNRFLFKRFRFNSMVGHVKLSTTCAFSIFRKAKAF